MQDAELTLVELQRPLTTEGTRVVCLEGLAATHNRLRLTFLNFNLLPLSREDFNASTRQLRRTALLDVLRTVWFKLFRCLGLLILEHSL